jgi:hypothetical protein
MRNVRVIVATVIIAACSGLVFASRSKSISSDYPRTAVGQDHDVPSEAEQAQFVKGQRLFNKEQYSDAVEVFSALLQASPKSIIRDLTLLWLGRSYIRMGELENAEAVGRQLKQIKDTPFASIFANEVADARKKPHLKSASTDVPRNSRDRRPVVMESAAVAEQGREVAPSANRARLTSLPERSEGSPVRTGGDVSSAATGTDLTSSTSREARAQITAEGIHADARLDPTVNPVGSDSRAVTQDKQEPAAAKGSLSTESPSATVTGAGNAKPTTRSRTALSSSSSPSSGKPLAASRSARTIGKMGTATDKLATMGIVNVRIICSVHTVVPGETFTQTIVIENLTGHLVREPRGEFVFGSPFELVQSVPASVYNDETRTAVWSLGQLAPREKMQLKVTVRVRNDASSGLESVGRGRLQTDSGEGNVEFDAPTIEIGSASKAGASPRSQSGATSSGFIS